MICNGLPDLDNDPDRHQNVISWSLDHTPALYKISSKSVGNIFDNPVNPDFALLDLDGDPDRHQNLSPWSLGHDLPLQKISSKSVHNFFSYPTDIQTDRQTDKQTEVKTSPPSAEVTILALRKEQRNCDYLSLQSSSTDAQNETELNQLEMSTAQL